MLRITKLIDRPELCRLKLEGKLLAPWLEVLLTTCPLPESRRCELDLSQVSFVDSPSLIVLRHLIQRGAVVTAQSPFVSELLNQQGAV